MSKRRLLSTRAGKGLYEIDDEFGRRQVWEPLPQLDHSVDPARRLEADARPKKVVVDLYGDADRARARENERRRAVDRLLEAASSRVVTRRWACLGPAARAAARSRRGCPSRRARLPASSLARPNGPS